jgi:hypothetical protein
MEAESVKVAYRIKNWQDFQHYSNRRPPWIKLHRTLLDDPEFALVSAEHARLLVWLWLIASEQDGGMLPDAETLAWRLRTDAAKMRDAITALAHWVEPFEGDASTMLAPSCKHDASTMLPSRAAPRSREAERERETETTTHACARGNPNSSCDTAFSRDHYVAVATAAGAGDAEAARFADRNEAGLLSPDKAWAKWSRRRTATEQAGGAARVARSKARDSAGDAAVRAKLGALAVLIDGVGVAGVRIDPWIADAIQDLPAESAGAFASQARRLFLERQIEEGRKCTVTK